ncbi:MAG: helix-turn-helix domain-containing protein [Candidatus Thalassarchaeaceae archaeon]|jgi:predicted DNA binding protein|nr:helix-turn-helix domain-containing protein [Candidatus Thalassarchaeaceae archaeon]MDP6703447.1 helix-turn-helix domain-containing protein [Candidatus Thalassarchaeaceae archaeon]MDP7004386.1 helix-turn-helix domain-containing protein [Candidatus Thalassarchaeaceae archaeon]
MRKVLLRWKIASLGGSKEISRILEIAERIEVLGHLSLGEDGVTQLAEVKMREGHELHELSELDSFEVLEEHEEDEDGVLASILCTHPLARTAIELSNIHVHPPYGIDSKRGLELRMSGLSDSIRRYIGLIRAVIPPDSISVQTFKTANHNGWSEFLTPKQREVLKLAVRKGYYEDGSKVTLKQLADEMEIARSTLGEHLKRVESEVMKRVGEELV